MKHYSAPLPDTLQVYSSQYFSERVYQLYYGGTASCANATDNDKPRAGVWLEPLRSDEPHQYKDTDIILFKFKTYFADEYLSSTTVYTHLYMELTDLAARTKLTQHAEAQPDGMNMVIWLQFWLILLVTISKDYSSLYLITACVISFAVVVWNKKEIRRFLTVAP